MLLYDLPYHMIQPLTYSVAEGVLQAGALGTFPYAFAYPSMGANPFYIGFGPGVPCAQDQTLLNSLLGGARGTAVPVNSGLPAGLPTDFRFFDISSYIPPYAYQRMGKREGVPGPNCYHVAMSVFGGERFQGRYVHDDEISYYLTRDFKVSADRNVFGGVLIYRRSFAGQGLGRLGFAGNAGFHMARQGMTQFGIVTIKSSRERKASRIPWEIGSSQVHTFVSGKTPAALRREFIPVAGPLGFASAAEAMRTGRIIQAVDPGVHGAINLVAGMVFQKGCFGDHCGYRIVEAGKAMSSIELKPRRSFDPPDEPERDENYAYTVYVPAGGDPAGRFGFNEDLSRRMSAYVPLMRHYVERFRRVKDKAWGDFKDNRIDLLSIENVWHILRDMDGVMKAEPNPMNALLKIDPAVAELYLEFVSLKWQYQAMVDRFAAFSDTWTTDRVERELRDLYRNHYIHADTGDFRDEIFAHLEMRGVDRARWDDIAAGVIAKVKEYDPVIFAPSDGAKGIPFDDILDAILGTKAAAGQ
jgi:hypothetical protein